MRKWSFAQLQKQTVLWRGAILPVLPIVLAIVVVRLVGFLQVQEWMAFDAFERLRPTQTEDRRITIIGISDLDLNALGGFPVPDLALARAISILQEYQPRAIGLDLFRDAIDPQDGNSDRAQLGEVLQKYPNIIGIEVALNPEDSFNVKPPPELPPERVGFADLLVDVDGKLRRALIASRTWEGDIKYSFALRLAQAYLTQEGIEFRHGDVPPESLKSSDPIFFGKTQLLRFRSNSGGYVGADDNGNQILLNFRAAPQPFAVLSLTDILDRNFDPDLIEDRIVLLGMTAASVKDTFITSAVKNTIYSMQLGSTESVSNQLIYGVEIHAHAASQIISAVMEGRSQIRVWADFWEYLWIGSWGLLGISLGIALQSPWKTILCLFLGTGGLVGASYFLLTVEGWWIPIVPTVLVFWGAGLTTAMVDRDLRLELEQRRQTIERTFDAVHNGPLQDLAVILRSLGEEDLPPEKLRSHLQNLNYELRGIYHQMRQDVVAHRNSLYLKGIPVLDLQTPISELLYTVYDRTLDRDFPGFRTILTYIPPNFAPLEACHLSPDQKRDLCVFLQEALCNAGKHGLGTTRLDVVCTVREGWYYLQAIDNGRGLESTTSKEGQGTHQAQALARSLGGRFERRPNHPQGTICQLRWPVSKIKTLSRLKRFW
ncbi:MAG: CHASE2 domain-containing protein [Cyanobacteriota bacterium]|nr:CHASE2 domain-containing protein [Cyanobacteriota bacterium]